MTTRAELDELAEKCGMQIQHDCGGFRLVRGGRYLFPDSGICPTATKRECAIFLRGWLAAANYVKLTVEKVMTE